MPVYTITAPNGKQYRMTGPAGLSLDAQIEHVLGFDPDADIKPPPPKTGVMASLQSGVESLGSSGLAGAKALFGNKYEAAEEGLAAQQAQDKRLDPRIGTKYVGEAYDKDGLWGAGKEVLSQIPRGIAQMAPQLGVTMAGAKAGAMAGRAFGLPGTLIGGTLGGAAAGFLPYVGSNVTAQEAEHPGEISVGRAATAAAAQSALDTVAPLVLMGGRVAGKVFGADVAALVAKLGPEEAEKIAQRRLLATVGRGAAIGGVGEPATEVLQQALERMQAGQDLLSEDALKDYGEAAYGGLIVGAPLGGAGHVYDRMGAQTEVADRRKAAEELAAKQVAQERAAKEQADAQALAQEKASPAYAESLSQQNAAYELQKKQLGARIAALRNEKTDAGNMAALALNKELNTLKETSRPMLAEYNVYGRPLDEQRRAQAAAAAPAPAGQEGPQSQLFQLPTTAVSPAKYARIEKLKAIVAEHDEMLPKAHEELVRIVNGDYPMQQLPSGVPRSAIIEQAQASLKARAKRMEGVWKELGQLDPEFAKGYTQAKTARDEAAAFDQEMATFDPAKARRDIERLTPKTEGATSIDQVQGVKSNLVKVERLQSLLAEHAKRQAAAAAQAQEEAAAPVQGDLIQHGEQEHTEAEQRAQRAQEWDAAAGQAEPLHEPVHGYAPPEITDDEDQARIARGVDIAGRRQRRTDVNEGFRRVFAPTQRSAIVDLTAQGIEAGTPQPSEGAAITQRLARLPPEQRAEDAKALQAHGVNIKSALYAGLKAAKAARKSGDSAARVESFVDAIRKIAALEQIEDDDIGPGRAHYRPEFYDIAAPLVPDVVQGARQILGMSAAKAGAGTAYRGQKLHERTVAREGARLEGVDDPALTAAMAADLEGGATLTQPETGRRHRVEPGTVQQREPLTDAQGQGLLFEPPAEAVPASPRAALRGRIDKLLRTPRLQPQARGVLERAADVLGAVEDAGRDTAQRVLENITEMVERAERGVGFSTPLARTRKVSLQRTEPAQPREVQGTGVLVGDEGELHPSTPTATVVEGPAGEASAAQRKALVMQAGYLGTAARKAVKEAQQAAEKASADPTNKSRAEKAEATAAKARDAVERAHAAEAAARPPAPQEPASRRPVALQALEQEQIGDIGRDADLRQPELPGMGVMHVGRATPAHFQRALDTGALPSTRGESSLQKHVDKLLTQGIRLHMDAAGLRTRVIAAGVALERLQQVSQVLRAHDPKTIAAATERTRVELMRATNLGIKAAATAKEAARRADEIAEAVTTAEEPGARAAYRKQVRAVTKARNAAKLQEEHIEHLRGVLRAFADADAAPTLEARAQQIVALRTEQSEVAAAIAENTKALRTAQGHAQRAREKRKAAITAPDVKRTQPTKLHMQQPGVKAYEPTQAEQRRTAASRSGSEYTALTGEQAAFHEATQKPHEALVFEGALQVAADDALEVHGVTQAALDRVAARVSKYDTAQAFATREGAMESKLATVEGAMSALERDNRGGMLPQKVRGQYFSAVRSLSMQEQQYKAAQRSDQRAKLQDRIDASKARINRFNEQRTPLADDPRYRELKAQHALLEFERAAVELRKEQVRLEETAPAEAKVKPKVARTRAAPGVVEPATKLITDKPGEVSGLDLPITRMLAKKLTKQQKTPFQGKGAPPTESMVEEAKERRGEALATDAALQEARDAKQAKGKPRKLTPLQAQKVMEAAAANQAEMRQKAAAARTAKSAAATLFGTAKDAGEASVELLGPSDEVSIGTREELFGEHGVGNLDEVLGSLETDGSTPLVRELARKLRPLVKDTGLSYVPEVVGSFVPGADHIKLGPRGLNERALLHETVHAATLRALLAPESALTRSQRNARKGLQALLTHLQNDPAFNREYGAVNLGELASEVMANQNLRDKIDAKKPGFWQRFKAAVLQMLGIETAPWMSSKKAMAEVEKLFQPSREFTAEEQAEVAREKERSKPRVEAFKAAPVEDFKAKAAQWAAGPTVELLADDTPALDAFGKQVTAASAPRGLAGAKAMIKDANVGLAAEYAGVDMRAPILKALKAGAKDAFLQGMYYIRMSDMRMSKVGASLLEGTLQLKKDATGLYGVEASGPTAGKDVFEAIGKLPGATPEAKFALAQSYMVAQRASRVGWGKLGWDTTEQYRALGSAALAEANANPALKAKLEDVRKVYSDYNRGMVQFLADTGAISKKLAHELTVDGDYVPFYRVGGSGVAELALGENARINVGDIRHQPYLHALKGDEGKLLPLNEAIMRNTMLLTDIGLKNLAGKSVAYSLQDMSRGADGKSTNPIRPGTAPAGADIIKFKQDGDDYWQRITSAGTPFEGIPAEMLVKSLEGSHVVLTGASKIAGVFGSLLRSGVTRTPAYLLRQLIRDPMSAAFTAGIERGPLRATMESMREFISQTRGTSETGAALLRKGVTQSGIFNGTADDMHKFALQLAGGEQPAYKKLFAALDRAAMRADSATRVQVYNDALKRTGSEVQAALAAVEMMNFTKRGAHPAVQYATRVIPFMNAQIQALNVLAKAFRGTATMQEKMQIKEKFLKNAMGLAAFSLLYSVGMEDDEDYASATAQERYNNIFVPNPFGHALKIPIPYEVGFLFKVLPEMIVRGMSDQFDDTDWEAWRSSLLGIVPGGTSMGMPQMIAPVIQSRANVDAFGNPIESASQQKLAKSERAGETTTEMAKAMSGWMSAVLPESLQLSGPKIEHLVRGYMGSMPVAIVGLADAFLADSAKPERMASQNPIYGAFIAKDVGTGPPASGYAALRHLEEVNATLAHLREEEPEKALAYEEEHRDLLGAKQAGVLFRQQLATLKNQQKNIIQSDMTGPQKREAVNDLARQRNAMSREFITEMRAMVSAR